jgi:hypothetical protein
VRGRRHWGGGKCVCVWNDYCKYDEGTETDGGTNRTEAYEED